MNYEYEFQIEEIFRRYLMVMMIVDQDDAPFLFEISILIEKKCWKTLHRGRESLLMKILLRCTLH